MTDKQIIIDEIEINQNDWLEPYKPIPACEIKDCEHWVYAGNNVYGCRIAEDGLVCDDFNNDDECCMYRQLEYYKEALQAKEQECEELKHQIEDVDILVSEKESLIDKCLQTLTEIKEIAEKAKKDICNNCGWRNTDSCDAEDYTCGEFIKILQKIRECEVGNG